MLYGYLDKAGSSSHHPRIDILNTHITYLPLAKPRANPIPMPNPPPTILLTGATGFVGGTILNALSKTSPNITIIALLRHASSANALLHVFPNLQPLIGDLSDLALLRSTAAQCDLVIHPAGDDSAAVCAMIDGLAASRKAQATTAPSVISLTGPRSLIDLSRPITGSRTPGRPWNDIVDQEKPPLSPQGTHARGHRPSDSHARPIARRRSDARVSRAIFWTRQGTLQEGKFFRVVLQPRPIPQTDFRHRRRKRHLVLKLHQRPSLRRDVPRLRQTQPHFEAAGHRLLLRAHRRRRHA